MASIKLAEALLLRKELMEKVDRLRQIRDSNFTEMVIKRINVNDGTDEVRARVPKISINQANHAFDWHAKALREVDSVIQQQNWTAEVNLSDDYLKPYVDPYVKDLAE